MAKSKTILVKGNEITIIKVGNEDYISITDMLKAKDGDFFIADWLRNRNTVEFLGIWESVYNPGFNYGEFAIIKSQADLKGQIELLYYSLLLRQVRFKWGMIISIIIQPHKKGARILNSNSFSLRRAPSWHRTSDPLIMSEIKP